MDHESKAASKGSAVGLKGQAQADANQPPMGQAHTDVNEPHSDTAQADPNRPPSKQAQANANHPPPNTPEPNANQPHSNQLQAEAILLPSNQPQPNATFPLPNCAHSNANHFPTSYNSRHHHIGTSRPRGSDNRDASTVICISIYANPPQQPELQQVGYQNRQYVNTTGPSFSRGQSDNLHSLNNFRGNSPQDQPRHNSFHRGYANPRYTNPSIPHRSYSHRDSYG
jgi:hypothetical protein